MFKYLSLTVIFIAFTQVAHANTAESAYLANSILPQELKVLVIEALQQKCPHAITPYGLHEIQTELKEGAFQGVPYKFFTTEFESRYLVDGLHPGYTNITVYSEERGIGEFSTGRIVSDVCEQ